MSYPFGKGIYFTDCFSAAAIKAIGPQQQAMNNSQRCFVFLSEVALGDIFKTREAFKIKGSAPIYNHSVQSIGEFMPEMTRVKDMNGEGPKFRPTQETLTTPKPLFLNTGKMVPTEDLPISSGQAIPSKVNEFIVFDDAQVRLRYLFDCEVVFKTSKAL